MRIALIVNAFPVISETFVLNDATGLLDLGHDVHIYARGEGDPQTVHPAVYQHKLREKTKFLGIPKSRAKRLAGAPVLLTKAALSDFKAMLTAINPAIVGRRALSFAALYQVLPFMEDGPFDVVHCYFGPNGNLGVLLNQLGIARHVVTSFHGYDLRRGLSEGPQVYGQLLAHGDHSSFLVEVDYARQVLIELGFPRERIVVQPRGVDLQAFSRRESGKRRERETSESGILNVATVARLVEEKGLTYGIAAIADVMKRRPELKIRYTIIGAGPLQDELQQLVKRLGLWEQVHFFGAATAQVVPQIIRTADIFMLPSVQEAAGTVNKEAQASGVAVIATNVGGVSEIVVDGVTGFLVPPGDAKALADRLLQLIDDPGLRARMGQAGRRHALESFELRSLQRRLSALYAYLSQGGSPGDFDPRIAL